jgi:hypothetical protein
MGPSLLPIQCAPRLLLLLPHPECTSAPPKRLHGFMLNELRAPSRFRITSCPGVRTFESAPGDLQTSWQFLTNPATSRDHSSRHTVNSINRLGTLPIAHSGWMQHFDFRISQKDVTQGDSDWGRFPRARFCDDVTNFRGYATIYLFTSWITRAYNILLLKVKAVPRKLSQAVRSRLQDPKRWMNFFDLPNPARRTEPWGLLSL